MKLTSITLLLVFVFAVINSTAQTSIEVRGIYGHPASLWKQGLRLDSLGINAVFLHDKSITDHFMQRARKEGVKVFAEFATLNGKGYVDKHPSAWAIDSAGNRVQAATWFMGVCPNDPGFRKHRADELITLLSRFDIDGVWMDYVHWHAQFEDPEPILPETCFCDKCINRFQEEKGIPVPGNSSVEKARFILVNHDSTWRSWRCSVIAGWVKEFRQIIKREKPQALIGLYHCPWNDEDFNNARYRILGLDYNMLKSEVDVFSPMVYHKRMGRKPDWVRENVEWFSHKVGDRKIWPIVQAYNDPRTVTANEFEEVLTFGLSGKATGVMMFTTDAVASDPQKIEVMKKKYTPAD